MIRTKNCKINYTTDLGFFKRILLMENNAATYYSISLLYLIILCYLNPVLFRFIFLEICIGIA